MAMVGAGVRAFIGSEEATVAFRTVGLIVPLALGILLVPLAADAQQAAKVHRIGFLSEQYPPSPTLGAFSEGLRALGYADYKDFVLERRDTIGDVALLPDLAAELVRLNLDVIVADNTAAALAAKGATSTIPIVVIGGDPLRSGLVVSREGPGANITGVASLTAEVSAKRLELLREAVPKVSRVAVLWTSARPADPVALKDIQIAGQPLGVTLVSLGGRLPTGYDAALAAAIRERADALIIFGGGNIAHPGERRILDLVARHRLPAMYDRREYAGAGGFMAFGVSFPALARRAAVYVDKILRGARPADLPGEQPTKFELVINLKTAKALGITIPQSVLLRADEVIQ